MSTAYTPPEGQDPAVENRRKYESPRLERVGSLAELTQGLHQSATADGLSYHLPIPPPNTVLLTIS